MIRTINDNRQLVRLIKEAGIKNLGVFRTFGKRWNNDSLSGQKVKTMGGTLTRAITGLQLPFIRPLLPNNLYEMLT